MYKSEFPFFHHHPDLLYLDSAATSLKPQSVIERINHYLTTETAPVGRSLYQNSVQVTEHVEAARKELAEFIDAPEGHVIFTSGATDALNLLANGLPFAEGDEIILSDSEHHSNLVPWQEATKRGARLIFIEHDEQGRFNTRKLQESLSDRTRVVALSLVSNVFGTILPVGEILEALKQGSRPLFILDASQAAPHLPLSVRTLGCDALVLAGHKMYAPEGVGLLWGTSPLLESLSPLRTGGGMIDTVHLTESTVAPLPGRLEAGSPNTTGILGLQAAAAYLSSKNMEAVRKHTEEVTKAFYEAIQKIEDISLIGQPDFSSGIISFTHSTIHPHDIAEFLASKGVCVRAGHQCAQPLHRSRNITGSVRVSVGIYNNASEAEPFSQALNEAISFFTHA